MSVSYNNRKRAIRKTKRDPLKVLTINGKPFTYFKKFNGWKLLPVDPQHYRGTIGGWTIDNTGRTKDAYTTGEAQ